MVHNCLKTQWYKQTEGSSLIELALVLGIIGLLIAGILKGQELLESARLNAVVSQVNQYRLAVTTFQEIYAGALPGDYPRAKGDISPHLSNGNGNGTIEGEGFEGESAQFWAHLNAAQLISLNPGSPDSIDFGLGLPESRLGGGFTVVYNPQDQPDMAGHWFLLGARNGTRGNGALLTPEQAMRLDKKVDNGTPTSGQMRAVTGQGAQGECVSGNSYNLKNKKKACIVYFQF